MRYSELSVRPTACLLSRGEGELASLLPFTKNSKKPSGSPGDPLHVIIAGMPSVSIPGVPNALSSLGINSIGGNPMTNQQNLISSLFPALYRGGSTDNLAKTAVSAASGAGSLASGASELLSGLSFFADGTPPLTRDTAAIVGEQGPELLHMKAGMGVVPNKNLGSLGGDTHQYKISVDARGSTDPAQVRKMVNEGIMAAAPHITHAAVSAVGESRKRAPASRH